MSELCLDCLNKIMRTNDPPRKYIAKEMLCEAVHNLRKLR